SISTEILESIAHEIPEYARPLEGRVGRGIRRGVEEALAELVALSRDPDAGRGAGREVYLALGRGEQRAGRTLDSLQAAYRIGARISWRRFPAACRRGGVGAEPLALWAEAVFAYIDELAADSVEGFSQAQAEVEDLRRRRRRELIALLLADPPADSEDVTAGARAGAAPPPPRGGRELIALLLADPPADSEDVTAAARAAAWEVPTGLAAMAGPEDALGRVARRPPPD